MSQRLFKQLLGVFVALIAVGAVALFFAYEIVKVDWVVFMEIQSSFDHQENPLAVPERSIPIEGAAYLPGKGEPVNPIPADEVSIARGKELFQINCMMCHGAEGKGDGTIGAFLVKKKPADLSSDAVQVKADGNLFLSISNGIWNPDSTLFPDVKFSGQMPPLAENLTVRERWDVVNYIRTLKASQ